MEIVAARRLSGDGELPRADGADKPFKDIVKAAGIERRFTPHGCRRTGAKLYGRTAGTRIAMDIAGHRTEKMHHHYAPTDAAEKQDAARKAFGGLRALESGSRSETVYPTVYRGPDAKKPAGG